MSRESSSTRRASGAFSSLAAFAWAAVFALILPSVSPATPRFTAPFLPFVTDASAPQKAVAGDFDEDSISDLVISHDGSPVVTIVFGNGDGTFGPPTMWSTGANSVGIAAADLNGDGHTDIVVGHRSPEAVAVRLGNGDGTFGAKIDYSLGDGISPVDIVIQDLNSDSRLDLAVACRLSNSIAVLFGAGDGRFGSATNLTLASGGVESIAAGRLNGDLAPDLAVGYGSGSSILILLNTGDGSFPLNEAITMGASPRSVAIADVSGDGSRDLVSANYEASTVSVRLGNGNGTFQTKTDYATPSTPNWLTVGNLDNNALPDIAVANAAYSYDVSVFLSTGGGGFAARADFHAGNRPIHVTTAELNGDGSLDLAVVLGNAYACSVLLGNGDGTFGDNREFPANAEPQALALGDLNGDGRLDVAQVTGGTEALSIYLATGGGFFAPRTDINVGTSPATSVAIGDLNADGRQDLAVTMGTMHVAVMVGTGGGAFDTSGIYTAGSSPAWVAIGDVSQDNWPDLVVANQGSNNVSVRLGAGDGSFGGETTYAMGTNPVYVALGDLNADGRLDMVTANNGSSDFSIRYGTGGGSFGAKADHAAGAPFPKSISIGRIDSNASLDLAVGRDAGNGVSAFLNDGSGGFTSIGGVGGYSGKSVSLVDVNGDGRNDLVSASQLLFGVAVSLGNGDGTFDYPEVVYGAGRSGGGTFSATGDLNDDGRPDIVVGPYWGGGPPIEALSILLNRSSPAPVVSAPVQVNAEEGGTLSFQVSAADLDDDPIEFLTANLSGLPAGHGAVFTPNISNTGGTFTWSPKSAEAGTYNVTFTAVNAQSGSATTRIDVAAAGASIAGSLFWTPSAEMTGTFDIVYTATDQLGDTTFAITRVTVTGGGTAAPTFRPAPKTILSSLKGPVIRAISSTSVSAGSTLLLAPSASGATTLTASTSGLPAGNNATFATDTQPDVAAPITVSGDPGDVISISIAVSDPDGNAITSLTADLSSLPLPNNAVFTPDGTNTAGTFTWTPALADSGIYGVTFIAANAMVTTLPAVITVGNHLAAYWKLNGDGADAARGNMLFAHGGVTFAPGKLNQAASVDGAASSRLEGVAIHDYDMRSTGFTAECWVKPLSLSPTADPYIARADSGGNAGAWEMYLCGSSCPAGRVGVRVVSSGTPTGFVSSQSINDGLFHHVAMTYDGATLRLYIDGAPDNSLGAPGLQVSVGGGKIALGNAPSGTNPFDGFIDDFRIWKRAKSAAQIQSAMNSELGFPTGVEEQEAPGVSFALFQNRPNPFNPYTSIRFDLPRACRAQLDVYDVRGRLVARLLDRELPAGPHSVSWSGKAGGGRDVASGIYFYRLEAAGFVGTRRMALLR